MQVRNNWRDTVGTDIHEAFGQTECSTFISGSPSRPAPPDTLGYAQPGRAIAIVDQIGPVSRGQIGDIAVRADDPGLALSLPDLNGDWVRTGDVGAMADDGAITYHGRVDDILTSGGYRLSPIEIERVFEALPEIDAAAAVDYRLHADTSVIALYYTAAAPLDEKTLSEHATNRLAIYKRPRLYVHTKELPVGTNGKLLRRALRTEKETPS